MTKFHHYKGFKFDKFHIKIQLKIQQKGIK